MSQTNLSDKISETITNVFKKTQLFEKIEKMEFYIRTFVVISSIISLSSIYINYYNTDKIKRLEEKIQGSENIIKYNIEINRKQNEIIYNKLIEEVKNELEKSSKLINIINEKQNFKPEMLSVTTSISSLSLEIDYLIKDNNENNDHLDDDNDNNENNDDLDYDDLDYDDDDDELINECYDAIPLNNLKKNISLNWFLNNINNNS